jgi:mono/diheme cytochrome c family protein
LLEHQVLRPLDFVFTTAIVGELDNHNYVVRNCSPHACQENTNAVQLSDKHVAEVAQWLLHVDQRSGAALDAALLRRVAKVFQLL